MERGRLKSAEFLFTPFLSVSLSVMDSLNSNPLLKPGALILNSVSAGKSEPRGWEPSARFEMSDYFPKDDTISGLNLRQRSGALE